MNWSDNFSPVAILRGITPEEMEGHLVALLESGFNAIEIPTNSPRWQESVKHAVAAYGERALIGAGTVLLADQVDELAALGGKLVVTPNVSPAVIERAVQHDMLVCAGFATASEAFTALEAGAQALKLFPASVFGPDYLRALKAVLPSHIPLLAVGGITPDNFACWLEAGCCNAGLGSDLYRPGQTVERTLLQAQAFMAVYRQFRHEH